MILIETDKLKSLLRDRLILTALQASGVGDDEAYAGAVSHYFNLEDQDPSQALERIIELELDELYQNKAHYSALLYSAANPDYNDLPTIISGPTVLVGTPEDTFFTLAKFFDYDTDYSEGLERK